jgi:hypothetical protein
MACYAGSCHCGAVRFEIDVEITDLYTCDCSLCRKRNALMTSVPEARFRLLQGADTLTLYQWNTRIARHYFCSVCGVYPFHRKRATPDHYAINVQCLQGFDPGGFTVRRAEGRTMSMVDPDPQPDWTGPRD